MVRVVFDNRCPAQHAKHIIQHDILFHHLLMGVCRDANTLSLRLEGEAIGNSFDVVRIHIRHDPGRLRCIGDEFKITFGLWGGALATYPGGR